MRPVFPLRLIVVMIAAPFLAACGMLSLPRWNSAPSAAKASFESRTAATRRPSRTANEVVLFALGLIETGYRFGGKNPEAGLDCSGMVSYVFREAGSIQLLGSAADMAKQGRSVERDQLRPGDLVFFGSRLRPHSHVGIYVGENRIIHAPSSRGRVRTESLFTDWFDQNFQEARSYFD